MAEILIKVARTGARFSEVPMALRCDLKGGARKMPVGQTAINTLKLIARLRAGVR